MARPDLRTLGALFAVEVEAIGFGFEGESLYEIVRGVGVASEAVRHALQYHYLTEPLIVSSTVPVSEKESHAPCR